MKPYPLLTLIADDSEDDRFLFSRAVRALPELRLAAVTTDGVETLAYLNGCAPYGNRVKFPYPDLILLDYQMPGYDGLEVLASMPREAPRPKVVLWSDAIELVNQRLAYRLGAAIVCAKPVMPLQIQSILKAVQPRGSNRSTAIISSPWQDSAWFYSAARWGLRTTAYSVLEG
jgi:CheY-like chemotaxis protein